MSYIDLTRVGPNTGARDYSMRNADMQATDRSGIAGFFGKLFSPIGRSEQEKEANRAAVREYIGQVAEKFGLPAGLRVAGQLQGHLVRGNPLSSHRVAILNATLPENPRLSHEEGIAGSLARLLDGVGAGSDFGRILTTPFKRPALDQLKAQLAQFADSIRGRTAAEQHDAIAHLVDAVAQRLVAAGLDGDKVAIRSRVVEPLVEALGLRLRGRAQSALKPPAIPEPARDLTTPQSLHDVRRGVKSALTVAFECSSAMVLAEATKTEGTMDHLVPHLSTQVSGFFDAINAFVTNPTDVGTLKHLKGLLEKGFAPGSGGIGRFAPSVGWKPSWVGSAFKPDKPLDDPENQRALADLKAMAAFFAGHARDHIVQANVHERDMRAVQFSAIVGMVFNDVLMEPRLAPAGQVARDQLKALLIAHHAIRDNQPVWSTFRTNVRASPLMMELDNPTAVAKLLEVYDAQIEQFIPHDLSPEDRATARKALREALSRSVNLYDTTSGSRGRFPGANPLIAQAFSNRHKALLNVMDMPDPSLDGRALHGVEALAHPGSKGAVRALVAAIETTDLVGHGSRPITIQRPYTLPSGMQELILDPRSALLAALETIAGPHEPSVMQALDRIRQNVTGAPDANFTPLRNLLRDTPLTDKIGRNYPAGTLATEPSVMTIIHKHNQRSLCGISGTTTDICLGLTSQMDIDRLKAALLPVIEFANTNDLSKLTDEFRSLFTSISMFMQGGQYHTPAEVLGGMLMAAATLFDDPELIDRDDSTAMREAYDVVLGGLTAHPERFFAVKPQDQQSFLQHAGEGAQSLHDIQTQGIKARLDAQPGGGTFFEA